MIIWKLLSEGINRICLLGFHFVKKPIFSSLFSLSRSLHYAKYPTDPTRTRSTRPEFSGELRRFQAAGPVGFASSWSCECLGGGGSIQFASIRANRSSEAMAARPGSDPTSISAFRRRLVVQGHSSGCPLPPEHEGASLGARFGVWCVRSRSFPRRGGAA